jgi:hypothetical protein
MTRLALVVIVAAVPGCRHASALPVVVQAGAPADASCVDRLVTLARKAGYVDEAVDRSTGFLRVQLTALRNGKPIRTGARGMTYSFHLQAQCARDGASAAIYGSDSRGVFTAARRPPGWLRSELESFAAQLASF